MPSVHFTEFGGIRPAVNAKKLDTRQGQEAHNVRLRDGQIKAMRKHTVVPPGDKIGLGETVDFHALRDMQDCCGFSLEFDTCVSVVYPPNPGTCPGFSHVVVFPNSCDCPSDSSEPYRYFPCEKTSYPLYVPAPFKAPMVTLIQASTTIEGAVYRGPDERAYIYTYVDRFGVESPPSPVSLPVYAHDDEHWRVSNFGTPPINAVCMRLYRTNSFFESGEEVANPFNTSFQLVKEIELGSAGGSPLGINSYDDTDRLCDIQHGSLMTTQDCPPPKCMDQVVETESGYYVGFAGNTIFVSERYEPHNWPEKNRMELPDKVVGLAVNFDMVYVGTTGRPYRINIAFTAQKNNADTTVDASPFTENLPCLSKHALTPTSNGAMYSTHRGLVQLASAGPARLISRHQVDEDDWLEWSPNVGVWHHGKYYGAKSPAGRGFLFDIDETTEGARDLGSLVTFDWSPLAVQSAHDGSIHYTEGGEVRRLDSSQELMTYTWHSKVRANPGKIFYSVIKVVGDYGTPIDVTVYADDKVYATLTLKSGEPCRLPRGLRGLDWSIKISGTTTVCELHMATSFNELTNVRSSAG